MRAGDLERAVELRDVSSSVGMRLEYYSSALEIISENPVFGVGVASIAEVLERRYKERKMELYTDNIHSEFLNISVAAGVLGLALFPRFLFAIAYDGNRARRAGDSGLGDCLIGLAFIFLVSAMFNSTIKDFGEKHILIVTSVGLSRFLSWINGPCCSKGEQTVSASDGLLLLWICNSAYDAESALRAGIDWIFVDIETRGKSARQPTTAFISKHKLRDVETIKSALPDARIVLRGTLYMKEHWGKLTKQSITVPMR